MSSSQYLARVRAWWASDPPDDAERLFAQRVLFDAAIAVAVDPDRSPMFGWPS